LPTIGLTCEGSGLELALSWTEAEPATLTLRLAGQVDSSSPSQPLVEALAAGHGRDWSGRRFVATAIGQRLRYTSHRVERCGSWRTVWFTQRDEVTGLELTSQLSVHDEECGLRSITHVRNGGSTSVTLHAVSSLVFADFGWESAASVDAMRLLRGTSDWLAEGRWAEQGLRDAGLPALSYQGRSFRTRGCIEATSLSSWPTAYELPTGVIRDPERGRSWAFQIEHNGAWTWQIGELPDGVYLALLGPTDEHHSWQLELAPGEAFETVAASVALEPTGLRAPLASPASLASLTSFRRVSLTAPQRTALPVIFNDYMNTVNGDPSADVLRPLVEAAAEAGAEYFVIDAGWYAEDGDWWDNVGEWQPSTRRFPEGFDQVLTRIRQRGMVPGLWLEPEVLGVNSPMAEKLPNAAFLQRDGIRVVDHGRYHLDFSADETVVWLNEVVDRLVNDHQIGYFKFDYNIRAGIGSDARTPSAGHGLLLHNRAYLGWVDSLRSRHPQLLLENCASGGMRQDFATLSRFDVQSTSDQEDVQAYAPIAASAPMLVLPEQMANWGYPQPEMSDEQIVFTLTTALTGRLYLSGWLDRLSDHQRALVAEAVTAHKRLAARLPFCHPFWPLGLPRWDDEWIVLGLHDASGPVDAETRLTIWRRSERAGQVQVPLPNPPAGRRWAAPEAVFPLDSQLALSLSPDASALDVVDHTGRHAARVVSLTARPDH
jgi:alpha-galactosidase